MPIGHTGFIALSCIPKGQYYSSLVTAVIALFIVIIVGLVFILFLIGKLSGNIVKLLAELNSAAMELAKGNLDVSIEAARAGEAGKGFAVVAGEIGGLANESADAVNTTRNLIDVSLNEIEKGNAIVNDVMAFLDNAVERVRVANGTIQETAQVADVQMKSIDQIRDGIKDMSQAVQDNSAMAEETSATSEELAAQSVTLNELVQTFELE